MKKDIMGVRGRNGRKGELLVLAYLKCAGFDTKDVTADATGNFEYEVQGRDIMFKQPRWSHWLTADVKTNMRGGKAFFEMSTSDRYGNKKIGWFFKSQSTRIFHVDLEKEQLAYYDLGEMRSVMFNEPRDNITTSRSGDNILPFSVDQYPNIRGPFTLNNAAKAEYYHMLALEELEDVYA